MDFGNAEYWMTSNWGTFQNGKDMQTCTHATLTICKTLHLAQMDQARSVRSFVLPDSTVPRVTASVLGYVVASRTCMVQVP